MYNHLYKDHQIIFRKRLHKDVIIIGAGMAGLGAAWNFKNLGFEDFLILEATDKPGGRIETFQEDGYVLDLGAQWIHGKNNSLYKIAASHDLLSNEQTIDGSGIFVRNDGLIFDEFLCKKVDWEIGKILEKCNFLQKSSHPKSVKHFLDQEFEKYSVKTEEEDSEMLVQLYDWHIRFQTIDNSCINLDTVSAKYWGSYVCTDENSYCNLKNGYKPLVDVIFNRISNKHFVFNDPVISIVYEKSSYTVTTNSGKEFTCNHVILTPSLGVLRDFKNISTLLSDSMVQTIKNTEFYGMGKIFLIFERPWWGDLEGFQFLWNSRDDLDDSEKWFRDVTGFETVLRHPNVLMGMIGGKGVAVMEKLEEEEVGKICIKQLRRFLPHFQVAEPKKVLR